MKLIWLAFISLGAHAYDRENNFQYVRHVLPDVSWEHTTPSPEAMQKYTLNVKTPYGAWVLPLSRWVEQNKLRACTWSEHLIVDPQFRYYDGEIPCGMAGPDGLTKTVYQVHLSAVQFAIGDWDYTVTPGVANVMISRQSLSAYVTDLDLNTLSAVTAESSLSFADDIRVQNDGTSLTVCTGLPGVQVALAFTPRTVHGQNRTNLRLQETRSYAPDMQPSQYLLSTVCNSVTWNQKTPLLIPMSADPNISGLSVTPAKPPMDLVEEQIYEFDQAQIKKQLSDDAMLAGEKLDQEIGDGSWAPLIMADKFATDLSNQISRQAVEILQRVGNPLSLAAIQTQLTDRCRMLEMSPTKDKGWNDALHDFCQDYLTQIQFVAVPLPLDPSEQARGCYAGSANIFEMLTPEPKRHWWIRHCSITNRTELTLPQELKTNTRQFETLLGNLIYGPNAYSAWDLKMRSANVDVFQFWKMLDAIKDHNRSEITDLDWGVSSSSPP